MMEQFDNGNIEGEMIKADKTKYTVTYNGLTSEPSTHLEALGYQKAVKMMGGGDVEIVEVKL